jgi:tRNA A-37 threonylcarbamoyl transferase component Bud32
MNVEYAITEIFETLKLLTNKKPNTLKEEGLYEEISDRKIRFIFGALQNRLNELLSFLNTKYDVNNHYNAYQSNELISIIEIEKELEYILAKTDYSFELLKEYGETIKFIEPHLHRSGGSEIPKDYKLLVISRYEPVIKLKKVIDLGKEKKSSNLKYISQGSYANIYRFKDEFYGEIFALKRAKKTLSEPELIRFKKEFEYMKKMDSPYILKVYSYNENENEFVMEYIKTNLHEFISINNSKLDVRKRRQMVLQVFMAFNYIHSKGIYHRDISLSNILVKQYEDNSTIIKICDFGYLKESESTLTRRDTDFEGSLNDPNLRLIGPDKYTIQHEIYALTQIIYYIMTGRKNLSNINNSDIKKFH